MTGPLRIPNEDKPLLTIAFSGRRVAPWPEVEGALPSLAAPTLPPGRPCDLGLPKRSHKPSAQPLGGKSALSSWLKLRF